MYAGFWKRAVAYVIDTVILSFVSGILFFIVGIFIAGSGIASGGNSEPAPQEIAVLLLAYAVMILVTFLYFPIMESSKMQATVGKAAMSIKVTDLNGNKLSFWHALGRAFAKIISNLTFCIGYIVAGFTEKKQALHDMVASTLVVDNNYDPAYAAQHQSAPTNKTAMIVGIVAVCLFVFVFMGGCLAAIAIPQYSMAVEKSKMAEAMVMFNTIAASQERFNMANGVYSNSFNNLDIDFSGNARGSNLRTAGYDFEMKGGSRFSLKATPATNGVPPAYVLNYDVRTRKTSCTVLDKSNMRWETLCRSINQM
ncbi:putative RDD family membrane protein YckC/Tfp pilus assembly protein PilE [Elusimicrobium posterum]|uniref:RDD family protein n=1 Tax=Elusimicrobium posterum TaxID=3116653 RepID=UPI003C740107